MEDDIIVKRLEIQEDQILSMRRELNGIHASITDVEKRVYNTRLVMLAAGLSLILIVVGLKVL